MAEKHTVAMFVTGEDGKRTQVGWASPKDGTGVRTFEYSPGYEESRPKNVSFEDDELSQKVAAEQAAAEDNDPAFEPIVEPAPTLGLTENIDTDSVEYHEAHDAEPIEEVPDEELADDPTDASVEDETVELANGGVIVEVADEDEDEAEFQRLLAEEEAQKNQEAPATRREARENEENN